MGDNSDDNGNLFTHQAPAEQPPVQEAGEELLDSLDADPTLESHATETIDFKLPGNSQDKDTTRGALGDETQAVRQTWGDKTLRKLRHTHEVIAWMAASGAGNQSIAEQMGLSPSRISILLTNTELKNRIQQIRDEHWGANLQNRFNAVVPRAMDLAEQIIDGEIEAKTSERWDAAKWLLEKVTGKPKQEIEVDGGNSIRKLIQALDQVKAQRAEGLTGLPSEQLIDVEPVPPKDDIDDWVSQNIPDMKKGQT